ncbi:CHAT domain-containing protein [Iningainema tapete]|uniref:CHAT domain-containing protein n=1 Tax=Iningainema tapete BLCC-T55 TaxID=2748662 RepID=A0A8J6XA44_9CYAN|nr:CHAT domain-containing protein [Iningainema tapete]MBD2770885.1 CHAT domain-containing protein [Iningainema tapete BLCC-T55]
MAGKSKLSLTQRAITSPAGLSRTKQLPFETAQTSPKQTAPSLPEDIETATEEILLPPNQLYITMKLPKEVAILHIYQNGADEYSVWGGNAVTVLPQTQPNKPPDLSLGKLVSKGELPENIQDDMSYFSLINLEIRKWLKQLKRKFGEQLCLVIADHTDFEIPWEMLELSPDDSPNEYVGALITTVRWRQIIRGDDYVVLEFKADECCGNVVAYVLDTELHGTGPELDILEQLQAVIYRSSKHNIKEFQTHLQRNDAGCGFVYIACHGTLRSNIREITLGSNSNEQQQLKLLALRRCQLNAVKNSQGIVFINACHSGREQAHSSIPHSYRMGFVELFLAKGARGVIGTLGAVGDSHAAEFARDLIKESLRSPNHSIAALLKKLRLKVVEKLPEQPTTQDILPFIYTFMYVYYGNPMTVLRLTPPGGQANV